MRARRSGRLERPLLLGLAGLAVLGVLVSAAWFSRPSAPPIVWERLLPPREVPLLPWRWLVLQPGPGPTQHLRVAGGDTGPAGSVERSPWWTAQRSLAATGRADVDAVAVIVRLSDGWPTPGSPAWSALVELCAGLVARVPSLDAERIVAHYPRSGALPDLRQLRAAVRERLLARGWTRP